MKVKPRIKQRFLRPNEARIITIGKDAIMELLTETLMENKCRYFDLDDNIDGSNDIICIANWDRSDLLTYAVMPLKYCLEGYDLCIDRVNEKVGITTDSLFKPNRYKSIVLTEKLLQKTNRGTGNSSMSQ